MNKLFSHITYSFLWLLSLLPLPVLYFFSDIMFLFVYRISGYRKETVNTNLKNSFPEKTHKERRLIKKKFYRHFCDMMLETIKLLNMNEEEIKKRVVFKNNKLIDDYISEGKSVISILGHYGNWEWGSSYALHSKADFLGIYKPLHDPVFEKMFIKIRERFGAKTLPKDKTLRTMVNYHKNNKRSITAFIGDQTPTPNNINYWTQFLNQDTPILSGTEKISKMLNQPIVYAAMRKIKRGYYEIEFIPLFENPKDTSEFEISEAHTQLLEKIIQKEPEYWLWTHKRWKHKRTK